MSIIIQNISIGDPTGVQDYELRINQKVITRFQHVREDGLAMCLRKASQAVERQFLDDLTERMLSLQYGNNDL